MISSVIARLIPSDVDAKECIAEIAARPELDVGELMDGRLLPITIDAENQQNMRAVTEWIQDRPYVGAVDIVFVHFEEP